MAESKIPLNELNIDGWTKGMPHAKVKELITNNNPEFASILRSKKASYVAALARRKDNRLNNSSGVSARNSKPTASQVMRCIQYCDKVGIPFNL